MRIVMTLLARNEEDVIDLHLRHHLDQGVDLFVVTDNRSEDATRSILEPHIRAGVAHVIDEPEDDYSQARWVTRMAREAIERHGAEWVLHADADEFFVADSGSLRDALASVPSEFGVVQIPRLNFRPRPDGPGSFCQRMVVREVHAVNALGQPLPPKICHRGHMGAIVTMGNHDVQGTGLRLLPRSPLQILHYPLRSYAQFERKIRLGGAALARNRELGPDVAATWRWLHGLLLDGHLREYYESQVVDDVRLAEGLDKGELVFDERLALRFRALSPSAQTVNPARRRARR